MLFNSLEFLIFLPVVFYAYYLVPHRWRWPLLLVASYYFYMSWRVEYALLIVTSTIVDYVIGRELGKREEPRIRKALLAVSLSVNLGLLGAFKYAGFFARSGNDAINLLGLGVHIPVPDLLLPVGISFYTFQTLGYTIDVYRRAIKPEQHLGHFALYVAFWPQLVAGPIERAKNLMPELKKRVDFDYARTVEGLQLVLWGFFKKIVIADRVAAYVNEVYNHPTEYHGAPIVLATVLFAFQIFCDFSGYSDIAIGCSRMLGIKLMDNFDRPYHARSIGEFWRRWHISLSTWFRDYVYIPLGGRRVKRSRWLSNLFITFVVSGIWHGANWTFLVWGALHGSYLIIGIVTQGWREKLAQTMGLEERPAIHRILDTSWTFILVCIAWMFFRANSVGDALTLLSNMFDLRGESILVNIPNCKQDLAMGFAAIAIMEIVHLLQGKGAIQSLIQRQSVTTRWLAYVGVTIAILLFGSFKGPQFIYFQF